MDSLTLFLLISVGAFAAIIAIAGGLAVGLSRLDSAVRVEQARVAELPPMEIGPPPAVKTLSPVSQAMADGGVVEPPSSLQIDHGKLGIWIFLSSEIAFFGVLISSFVVFLVSGLITEGDLATLNIPLTSLSTFLLLASSFAVVQSLEAIERDTWAEMQLWLVATLVLGGIFIGIQAFEWNEFTLMATEYEEGLLRVSELAETSLSEERLASLEFSLGDLAALTPEERSAALGTLSAYAQVDGLMALENEITEVEELPFGATPLQGTFGTVFYVLTGFHGLHVLIGLIWLTIVIVLSSQGRYTVDNHTGIETFGLYWHFVDIVWIVLFTVIYLIPNFIIS
ncbi:MAG: heme-copper oxidase subunit III [Chloroflexi bacterium]|nr:heme-copper oxidase subunit III [Chloroflexota bacterium]